MPRYSQVWSVHPENIQYNCKYSFKMLIRISTSTGSDDIQKYNPKKTQSCRLLCLSSNSWYLENVMDLIISLSVSSTNSSTANQAKDNRWQSRRISQALASTIYSNPQDGLPCTRKSHSVVKRFIKQNVTLICNPHQKYIVENL